MFLRDARFIRSRYPITSYILNKSARVHLLEVLRSRASNPYACLLYKVLGTDSASDVLISPVREQAKPMIGQLVTMGPYNHVDSRSVSLAFRFPRRSVQKWVIVILASDFCCISHFSSQFSFPIPDPWPITTNSMVPCNNPPTPAR